LDIEWRRDGLSLVGLRWDGRLEVVEVAIESGAARVLAGLGISPAEFVLGMAAGREPAIGFGLGQRGNSISVSLLRSSADVWTGGLR
jgi:hypothetical protein